MRKTLLFFMISTVTSLITTPEPIFSYEYHPNYIQLIDPKHDKKAFEQQITEKSKEIFQAYYYGHDLPTENVSIRMMNLESGIMILDNFYHKNRISPKGDCYELSKKLYYDLKDIFGKEITNYIYICKGGDKKIFNSDHYFLLLMDSGGVILDESIKTKDPLIIDPTFKRITKLIGSGYSIDQIYSVNLFNVLPTTSFVIDLNNPKKYPLYNDGTFWVFFLPYLKQNNKWAFKITICDERFPNKETYIELDNPQLDELKKYHEDLEQVIERLRKINKELLYRCD